MERCEKAKGIVADSAQLIVEKSISTNLTSGLFIDKTKNHKVKGIEYNVNLAKKYIDQDSPIIQQQQEELSHMSAQTENKQLKSKSEKTQNKKIYNNGLESDINEILVNGNINIGELKNSPKNDNTEEYKEIEIRNRIKEMPEISLNALTKNIEIKSCSSVDDADSCSNNTNKRKGDFENDVTLEIKRKSTVLSDEKKIANLRKNIRDVMDENQLDTNTLAAQREESERLARVQEQQKIIREYQRQNAVNRQNVRTQNRVLSLLQGNSAFGKVTDLTGDATLEMSALAPDQSGTVFSGVAIPNKITDTYVVKGVAQEVSLKGTSLIDVRSDINVGVFSAISSGSPKSLSQKSIREKINGENNFNNEVVTIEDSSSEDDCILLSDDDEEEIEEDTEDDPQNSGLHVKDAYNVPDENGRVVVNIGHPEGELDIIVAPQIAKTIKPHQIGGVRFLFDNIIESTKRFNSSTGFGCILAHSMGLGKTLQVVCFCDIFLRHTDSKTVLCVMPINTIQNWASEFNMWTPKESKNYDEVRPRQFNVFVLNDQQKTLSARSKVILQWAEEGGVLLMGYELFRLLALRLINTKKKRGKNNTPEKVETESHRRLMENIHMALVKPGPDLVICDEGHRIKNSNAGISLALKQIRTRRRIVLTGYPLQNNLLEYWCMVDFVRPNYLGTKTEFSNMFERPIQNGQCIDSTPEDIKLMRYRAHVLHSLLVGFVQRRSHIVLQNTLPQKLEYVILTKMTTFQRKLYETFMNDIVRTKTVPNPLKAFAVCCKIWNHPDVLYNFLKKRETDLDLEIDDPETPDIAVHANGKKHFIYFENTAQKQLPTKNISQDKTAIEVESKSSNKSWNSLLNSSERHENLNSSETYTNSMYYSQNYYNHSNLGSTLAGDSHSTYWQESNSSYFGYQPIGSNIGLPLTADYVGLAIKQPTDQSQQDSNNSSSQIVDLDTKEIKTVETDIDMALDPVKCAEIQIKTASELLKTGFDKQIRREDVVSTLEKEPSKIKGDDGVPYEWAIELMKGYEPGLIQNSPKMAVFFCILTESLKLGDRVLVFSQSLLTLNLIEKFLQVNFLPETNHRWAKNTTYFRLDGSTTSLEREKLVNEFNTNKCVHLFLISTRAGSLGINLVGANRVIVFDASWNPCHDTQAVYRIYRYGQNKPCFVYRIVMDNCLEKKIYDRQVKKQGMSNRVVDECNPDAHLSMKDVTNLCYDYDEDKIAEFKEPIESYPDIVMQKILDLHKCVLTKEPFHHESLLIDRKEKKLSQAEKRLAQRGYEMEKKAAAKQTFCYQPTKSQYRVVRTEGMALNRPVASVRPLQMNKSPQVFKASGIRSTRWIPAEVWQRQGMTAQEMTLPLDVVIPTNSNDKSNIVLKAGQRVMVLKSPKGIYMQLDSGKIIAIRTSSKINQGKEKDKCDLVDITSENENILNGTTVGTKRIVGKDPNGTQNHVTFNMSLSNDANSNDLVVNTSENSDNTDNDDVVIVNESAQREVYSSEAYDPAASSSLSVHVKDQISSQSNSNLRTNVMQICESQTTNSPPNDKAIHFQTREKHTNKKIAFVPDLTKSISTQNKPSNEIDVSQDRYLYEKPPKLCSVKLHPSQSQILVHKSLQKPSHSSQIHNNFNEINSHQQNKSPEEPLDRSELIYEVTQYGLDVPNSKSDINERSQNISQLQKTHHKQIPSIKNIPAPYPSIATSLESANTSLSNTTTTETIRQQSSHHMDTSQSLSSVFSDMPSTQSSHNLLKDNDKAENEKVLNKTSKCLLSTNESSSLQHSEKEPQHSSIQQSYTSLYDLQSYPVGGRMPISTLSHSQNQMTDNNSYYVSRDSTHHQYYDNTFDGAGITSTYEYPPQFTNYSYGTYPSAHYHPHYHSSAYASSNPQVSSTSNPYYMRWPPLPPPHTSALEQRNPLYSSYPQNSAQSNQWHYP